MPVAAQVTSPNMIWEGWPAGSVGELFWRRLSRQVPRRRAAVTSRPAIVFSPHPDDETLGCGGTILLKRRAGAKVGIVFMTDGSRSHAALVEPSRMRSIRRAEALAACGALGVGPEDVEFHDCEDGRLSHNLPEATAAVESVLRRRPCEEIFVTHRLEPPPDHRACRQAVLRAIRRLGRPMEIWEYPIWAWARWPWVSEPARRLNLVRRWFYALIGGEPALRLACQLNQAVDIRDVMDAKRSALACHRSQTRRLVPDARYVTLGDLAGGAFAGLFLRQYEWFRRYLCR
jgi:LmbE family N-acetylglucosaminyl deacetylase